MKEEKKLYQKWWFWVCIVLIVLIVGFTSIVMVGFSITTSGISGVARQIQDISENATLYSSAGDNTLILQIDHYDKLKNGDLKKMLDVIKANTNTTLSNYSKFIVLNYFDNDDGQEDYMLLIKEYSLPDFTEIQNLNYIDYYMYEEMYENYTDLFNSVF